MSLCIRLPYLIFCVVVLAECFLNVRRMRMGGNARLAGSRQRKSWRSEPVSFFKIGVDLNGMSASEYFPLYQSFTNRMHIRKGHWFDQSNISPIIEKNICCSVILSGLIPLKSIPQMECIALPYNTRASTLWTPFDGRILGCQREPHSTTISATSLKLMRVQRLRGQSDYRESYSNDDTINEHYPNR